jgi:hypothetical protein
LNAAVSEAAANTLISVGGPEPDPPPGEEPFPAQAAASRATTAKRAAVRIQERDMGLPDV